MAVQLIADGRDLTEDAGELTWSNVDPGGYEMCSFTLPDGVALPPAGALVTVREGLELAWMGYVEEPGEDTSDTQTPGSVTAVGPGVLLKDGDVSVVFMDRVLGNWGDMARLRRRSYLSQPGRVESPSVGTDADGDPAIVQAYRLEGTVPPVCESLYDAGADNRIASLLYEYTLINHQTTDASFTAFIWSADDDAGTVNYADSGELAGAASGSSTYTPATPRRFIGLAWRYETNVSSSPGTSREAHWTGLAAIGDHGLPLISVPGGLDGFDPAELARWVFAQIDAYEEGVIANSDYVLAHSVYRDPVPHEQILNDLVGLLGWHWGVWGPKSLTSTAPTFHFRPPPTEATAIVARVDCQGLRVARRVSDSHNQARVRYRDAAGNSGTVLVELANPAVPEGRTRVLPLDAGTTDATVAAEYGLAALELEQSNARAAGPCELPAEVALPGGGRKPAHLLKSGIDRLRVTGLRWSGSITETDTRRYDTFRIRRLESRRTVGKVVKTAELDGGANLLEVLVARLQVAAAISV